MDDLRAVMDAAGPTRAAIVSMGVGVPVGVLFGATYPDRTSALVLLRGRAPRAVGAGLPVGLDRRASASDGGQAAAPLLRLP